MSNSDSNENWEHEEIVYFPKKETCHEINLLEIFNTISSNKHNITLKFGAHVVQTFIFFKTNQFKSIAFISSKVNIRYSHTLPEIHHGLTRLFIDWTR